MKKLVLHLYLVYRFLSLELQSPIQQTLATCGYLDLIIIKIKLKIQFLSHHSHILGTDYVLDSADIYHILHHGKLYQITAV